MATKKEKKAAYEKLTQREKQLFDAVSAAGESGVGFQALRTTLKVNSNNMLYARISKLKESGLLKVAMDGRVATYFSDYAHS